MLRLGRRRRDILASAGPKKADGEKAPGFPPGRCSRHNLENGWSVGTANKRALSGRVAPVHGKRRPRDVACRIGGEEQNRLGHFLRRCDAAEWRLAGILPEPRLHVQSAPGMN